MGKYLCAFIILVFLFSCSLEQNKENITNTVVEESPDKLVPVGGIKTARPFMSKNALVYYLSQPRNSKGFRYDLKDSVNLYYQMISLQKKLK